MNTDNELADALGNPLDLQIAVADLESKWTSEPEGDDRPCAACGKPIGEDVPLLLWRKDGREMLTLHWECAEPRMSPKGTKSFAS